MNKVETSLTVKELLEAGAHFGHQTSKCHPRMKPYVFSVKNGMHIIDISKTIEGIRNAGALIIDAVKNTKPILFIGTKRQARDTVMYVARECGEYFVNMRWPGGLLTNPMTRQSIRNLEIIEQKLSDDNSGLKKKEKVFLEKKRKKLHDVFDGIRNMNTAPGLCIIIDTGQESIATKEAQKLGIPIIGIIDTNSNPENIDCVIAANDDSANSISAILGEFGQIICQTKEVLFGKKEIAADEFQAKMELDQMQG